VFEQIADKVPELRELEESIATLEQDHANAQARVQALAHKTAQAREDDLNREAAALNAGTRPPKPQEPRLREQLENAERDAEILVRRLALAQSDRARYVQEHHERLARLLAGAQAAEAAKVSAGANELLGWLLSYFEAQDNLRSLSRLNPPVQPENAGGPESHTTVWGNINTRNVTGGPRRGDLESALRYLVSLGPATEVGEVEGESAEGAA
jgi:hypothetical protein